MVDTTAVSLPDFQEVVASVFVSLLTSPGLWWHLESYHEFLLYALKTKLKNVRKKGSGGEAIYKIQLCGKL